MEAGIPTGQDDSRDPASNASAAGLRAAVQGGAFFGQGCEAAAASLAGFLATPAAVHDLAEWFGTDCIALRDPEALQAALERDVAMLDAMLSAQLDAILHAGRLQALEGRWRGLAWLVGGVEAGRRVQLRAFDVRWPELCRDLDRAVEFDQSTLFRRIYEDEFGMPGGQPFGIVVIDHELRHRPVAQASTDDVGTVARLAAVAAAAFTPMVLGLHPTVLEVEDFGDLASVQDVVSGLRNAGHARWRALAGRADLRFVALTLPRLLARLPYGDDPSRMDGFRYREHAPDVASRCWTNAAFGFAGCAARAFASHGWPADVRGVETDRVGGGLVTGIPFEPARSGPPLAWPRASVECRLNHTQEQALVAAGLMPVVALPFGSELAFGATCSMQAAASYTGAGAQVAEANARLSAQLNSILCVSRFAHLIKVMGRDMVGSFRTADEIGRRLNAWLQRYVNTNLSSTGEARARFPLVAGDVEVQERPGQPGIFGATIRLQPHYQLDDVSTVFNLVTELAGPRGR